MNSTVHYVYGIVRSGFDVARAPAGIDDTTVELARSGKLGALVSRLDAASYGAAAIERQSADVSWLSPRAMAHDRVLTWAQEHGGVLPMPMFSLWGSDDALRRMLDNQKSDFERVFARVTGADEFGVRVHRRDELLAKSMDDLDAETRRLQADAAKAPPGQRYLLERKLDDQMKLAVRNAGKRMARQIFEELAAISRDAVARPLVADPSSPDVTLVLNGAFLVDRSRLGAFRTAVAERVRDYEPRGLTFDFTGPWPPYNFTRAKAR
jgi:hypothetical protein